MRVSADFKVAAVLFVNILQLWKLMDSKVTFQFEFNDHQSSVNVVRFSPCGRMIASASDRLIIVYEGDLNGSFPS